MLFKYICHNYSGVFTITLEKTEDTLISTSAGYLSLREKRKTLHQKRTCVSHTIYKRKHVVGS